MTPNGIFPTGLQCYSISNNDLSFLAPNSPEHNCIKSSSLCQISPPFFFLFFSFKLQIGHEAARDRVDILEESKIGDALLLSLSVALDRY